MQKELIAFLGGRHSYCANIFLSEAFVFDQEVKITFYLVHELQGRM